LPERQIDIPAQQINIYFYDLLGEWSLFLYAGKTNSSLAKVYRE
jgi:hypothetical protein